MDETQLSVVLVAASAFITVAAPPVYAWADRWLDRTVKKEERQ
ncbi:MAG: hypothetical protein PHQ43_06180 [Dehalococcoidales bacterium]|jgi:hypothetical protein|nr:hypothetical protein [Dehalococcoidales bacterium]